MSKIEDGGSAFPVTVPLEFQFVNDGMSLRDWFAGNAIAPIINSAIAARKSTDPTAVANAAYIMADAMIAARKDTTHDPR